MENSELGDVRLVPKLLIPVREERLMRGKLGVPSEYMEPVVEGKSLKLN